MYAPNYRYTYTYIHIPVLVMCKTCVYTYMHMKRGSGVEKFQVPRMSRYAQQLFKGDSNLHSTTLRIQGLFYVW